MSKEEIERRKTIHFYHKCKECEHNIFIVWGDSRKDRYGLIQCPECKAIEQIQINQIEEKT